MPATVPTASVSTLLDLPDLRVATLRLGFRALETVQLPETPDNVWRGLFGRFLHHLSPPSERTARTSLYEALFTTPRETIPVPGQLPHRLLGRLGLAGSHVPHPFILRTVPPSRPNQRLETHDTLSVEMTLIEEAISFLPVICAAFESFGAGGIGRPVRQTEGRIRRGRMRLIEAYLTLGRTRLTLYDGYRWTLPASCSLALYDQVSQLTECSCEAIPPKHTDALRLTIHTPVRLKYRGRVVQPEELTAEVLGNAMYRRLCGLLVCYGQAGLEEDQLEAWHVACTELAAETEVRERDLYWTDRLRFSQRQRALLPVSGMLGTFALHARPEILQIWRHLFARIEPLHLGKGSSVGNGWITVVSPLS